VSPIPLHISNNTSKAQSSVSVLHPISIIFIELTLVSGPYDTTIASTDKVCAETPLEESIPALDEIRKQGKTKYIGLSECSAATLRKANSSKFLSFDPAEIELTP
jgi:diketogulonate reductase-like aldo/keto reductase